MVAEDAPSTRTGAGRGVVKPRTGSGLSKAPHDPNVAKPSLKSASSKDSKDATKKEVEKPSSSALAPSKRKREALGDLTAKNGKAKPAIMNDKENHLHKQATAYVEIPAQSSKTHSSSTVSAPTERKTASSSATAIRSRIRGVKEELKGQTIEERPVEEDVAMVIEREDAPERVTRSGSSRIPQPGHSSGATSRRATSAKRVSSASHPIRRSVRKGKGELETAERVAKKRRTSSVGPDDVDDVPLQRAILLEEDAVIAKETAAAEEVKWDDLDKEDEGDPLMVSEYVGEIFNYLLLLERQTMPNPNYIDTQRDLAWKMRGILMDWLIQVHTRFRLLPETLFLAVNIVDRFLSARTVSLVRLQLVGITAIFIAAKYEEIMAPSLHNFIYCSDSTYEEKDILEAEKYILKSLDWNLSYPNPIHFLRRSSKADGYDLQVRTVAKYLIEISCVDWRLLPHPPSRIAAAGMWLARLILEKGEWVSLCGLSNFCPLMLVY